MVELDGRPGEKDGRCRGLLGSWRTDAAFVASAQFEIDTSLWRQTFAKMPTFPCCEVNSIQNHHLSTSLSSELPYSGIYDVVSPLNRAVEGERGLHWRSYW